MALIFNEIQATYVLLKDTFSNALKGSTNTQEAFEKLDRILVPATQSEDGLFSKYDKKKLDTLDLSNLALDPDDKYKLDNLDTLVTTIINNSNQLICQTSYVFDQLDDEVEWVVTHGLDTDDIIYMAYNHLGEFQQVPIEFINTNSFKLTFTEPAHGKVVVLGGVDKDCVDTITFIDTFHGLLTGVTTLQDALEIIDDTLVPATDTVPGLMTPSDKLRISELEANVENGGIGHISLTSGYGTYSYESNSLNMEYTIEHNLNSYNLTVTIMFYNDEGFWENILVPVKYVDENTIYFSLLEEKEVIVHINAVEYFFCHRYESADVINNQFTPKTTHTVTHNLKSFNLLYNIMVYNTDGWWSNDLARLVYLDDNTCEITLTEPAPVKILFIRI